MAEANAMQEVKEDQEDKLATLRIFEAQLAEMKRRIRQGDDLTLPMVTYTIPPSKKRKLGQLVKEKQVEELSDLESEMEEIDIGEESF
jgi:hypothetical protein